ncbi:MAG: efflux RND transporter periplasmic adaptor subunit [Planctomycetota bacterium]|jgi:HlyD family secretion protein
MAESNNSAPERPAPTAQEPAGAAGLRRGPAPKWIASAVAVLILLIAASLGYRSLAEPDFDADEDPVVTVTVRRGPLTVSVVQPGSIWSMEPLKIKSEVEGWANILELVEEGTNVTQADVEAGMVLVRLDGYGLEEREAGLLIGFYGAEAALTAAKEDHEIQKKQNESNVAIAELNLKFARLELERYLGAALAGSVIENGVDFSALADNADLGGVAQQTLRGLEADVLLADAGLSNQQENLEWTERLYEKGYVERSRLMSDRLAQQRDEVSREAAQEELRLFKRYTLPKEAEQRYSNHVEGERDLDRIRARARSQLAQSAAALKSSEASCKLEKERLDRVREMIENSTIRAPKPGTVVYGSSSDPWWTRQNNPVREGASVQENQTILRMPDLSTLAAHLSIPEKEIDKIKVGQPARISLEAAPDRPISGRVARVSPMASSEHAWLNPNSKVYETHVALDEVPENFIPGMSASVQIIVAELEAALFVPTQAVTSYQDLSFCWVRSPDGPQLRQVQVGHSTDKFAEVTDGLRVGEVVYLAPPDEAEEQKLEARAEALLEARKSAGEQAEEAEEAPESAPAQSEYVKDGELNWQKIGSEMRGLEPEQMGKKWEEILQSLTPEQRRQAEKAARGFRQGGGGRSPGGRRGPGAGARP